MVSGEQGALREEDVEFFDCFTATPGGASIIDLALIAVNSEPGGPPR